jgi:hypothetical protein
MILAVLHVSNNYDTEVPREQPSYDTLFKIHLIFGILMSKCKEQYMH